jgi:hypothetical protein
LRERIDDPKRLRIESDGVDDGPIVDGVTLYVQEEGCMGVDRTADVATVLFE